MPRPAPPSSRPSDVDADVDVDADDRPSKSALKREAHELQKLGAELAELPDDRVAALPMPDVLLEALRELRRTRSHEGRRRQLQFVGKMMRRADVEPLRQAVAEARIGPARQSLALHRAERWRAELVADPEAITRWLAEHPGTDSQKLRSLVRRARQDGELPPEQRHGTAWRELFQFVKPHVGDT